MGQRPTFRGSATHVRGSATHVPWVSDPRRATHVRGSATHVRGSVTHARGPVTHGRGSVTHAKTTFFGPPPPVSRAAGTHFRSAEPRTSCPRSPGPSPRACKRNRAISLQAARTPEPLNLRRAQRAAVSAPNCHPNLGTCGSAIYTPHPPPTHPPTHPHVSLHWSKSLTRRAGCSEQNKPYLNLQ